jgi:TolB-like protein/Tfp pilus assembly protein PilF
VNSAGRPPDHEPFAYTRFDINSNLSKDPANAYFVVGIQDTILTKLSGIADLHVISRTSTAHYPSHPRNLRRIARELGVATVLEGSIQKAGNQVLINVQLIDAASDNHIWAQAYTRSLDNVFAVESDVAEQVAAALKAKLLPAEKARVASPPTRNPHAYDLFLRANYLAAQITGKYTASDPAAVTARATSLYNRAIALDPNFALAYARLSYLESRVYWRAIDHTPQRIAVAEKNANKALALAPDLGEAHLAAGFAAYYGNRDYATALKQFKDAAHLLPNNAEVLSAIALIQRRQGDWQEALINLRKAEKLDPRNSHWSFDIGSTLALPRHYRQAIPLFDQALAIEPYNFLALTYKVWTQLLSGQTQRAERTINDIPTTSGPLGQMASVRFQTAWLTRQPKRALAALAHAPGWIQAPDFIGQVPVSLLRAQALAYTEDKAGAQSHYEAARAMLLKKMATQRNNPDLVSALALAEAGLNDRASAIRDGRRAVKLLPVSKDAVAGTLYLATLAKIYAHAGEAKPAAKVLGQLLAMPAGLTLSASLLKLDPVWDPIRHDPAFQALLKKYGPQTAAAPQS